MGCDCDALRRGGGELRGGLWFGAVGKVAK